MRRLLVLAALVVAALPLTAGSAVASEDSLLVDVPGDSRGFAHELDAPMLQVGGLAPGATSSTTIGVRNSSAYAARLDLSTFDVADDENACVRPETREAGEDCGSEEGELSQWLQVSVAREQGGATLWSGGFSELAAGVTLTEDLPAGATWPLRVTVALPHEATNATMTDRLSFGTRLSVSSQEGRSEVAGPIGTVGGVQPQVPVASTTRSQVLAALADGPLDGRRVGFPLTGASITLWALLLDVAAVLGGVLLVTASRRRRATRPVSRMRA